MEANDISTRPARRRVILSDGTKYKYGSANSKITRHSIRCAQVPLSKESLKYRGVATPFKGVRVYVRSAMGMPGSETSLEELMCRVLSDLLQEGNVAKLGDDLYCGGNTIEELL